MNEESYYQILGVSDSATSEAIKEAYLSLCRDIHPDILPVESGSSLRHLAEQRMKQVNIAYATLKDEKLRRDYDFNSKSTYAPNENTQARQASPQKAQDIDPLSESIIQEGLSILISEEKELFDYHFSEMARIQKHYGDYLLTIPEHDAQNFSPDDQLARLNRFLKIFYLYLPVLGLFMTALAIVVVICGAVLDLMLVILFGSPLGLGTFLYSASFYAVPFLSVLLLAVSIFDVSIDTERDDKIEGEKKKVGSYYLFSSEMKAYHDRFLDFGSDIKFSNFSKPIYDGSYATATRKNSKSLVKKIEELNSSRRNAVEKFKELDSSIFENQNRIEKLSKVEKFLLFLSLKEKIQEEKDAKQRRKAMRIAGAIGLTAAVIGSGGRVGF